MKALISVEDYTLAITEGKLFYMEFQVFDADAEACFLRILRRFLSHADLLYSRDVLITILKELINNAVKANAKRLFFQRMNLDIRKDYFEGMTSFSSSVLRPDGDLMVAMQSSDYKVRIYFENRNSDYIISVWNNTPIVPEEIERINSRIEKARHYSNISEAFGDTLDDSEGAGLGLIMASMVFRNAGFDASKFIVHRKDNSTIFSLALSRRTDSAEIRGKIAQEINNAVENIPAFPENSRLLIDMCKNPDVTIKHISDFVKRDPGLSASILKLANSAGYITSKKISSIEEASVLIGLNGIQSIAMASGVDEIVNTHFKEFKYLWMESYKKAFYAYKIAIQLKNAKIAEKAYLAALLSKIGRILLLSIKKETAQKLAEITRNKTQTEVDILEEIALGVSISTLGSLIVKRWHFDDDLSDAIEYHRKPHMVNEKNKSLNYTVYLAHVFCEAEIGKYRFEIVDEDVLSYFNLADANNFKKLHDILIDAYNTQMKNIENLK